jgi:hypothetical protein
VPDADADDDDRAHDDPGEEDRNGDGDDYVSHGRPPYFQLMVGSLARSGSSGQEMNGT